MTLDFPFKEEKPAIYRAAGKWCCADSVAVGWGSTPSTSYADWRLNWCAKLRTWGFNPRSAQ